MEFFNKFGVPWLDRSFGEALQDDSLVELFGAVSDSLGPLLRGSYDTDVKQMILINLLGPAFICKHFRFLLLEKQARKAHSSAFCIDLHRQTLHCCRWR